MLIFRIFLIIKTKGWDRLLINIINSDEMIKYLPESGQLLGTLRKNLISALGMDRAKGFLLRYGWDCGEKFSELLKSKDEYSSLTLEDLFLSGSQIHGLTADLGTSVTKLVVDPDTKDYFSEGYWKYSQEAEKHIEHFGLSYEPVCFTLTGYAGGYVSSILGRQVIFKEVECKGKGDPYCRWIAKPVADWAEEIMDELPYYQEENLGQELDNAFKRIEEQKDVFKRALQISEKLPNAILNGSGLQGLIRLIEKEMNYPVIIENIQFERIEASSSVKNDNLNPDFVNKELKKMIQSTSHSKKTILLKVPTAENEVYSRLISPIFLRNKLFGFLSFIKKTGDFSELDYLLIERASSVSAIQILNETSAFENEHRLKEELLNVLFQSDTPQADIIYRLKLAGYHIEQPQYVYLFHLNKHDQQEQLLDEAFIEFKKSAVDRFYKALDQQNVKGVLATRFNQIIVLIPEEFVRTFPSLVSSGAWLLDQVFAGNTEMDITLGISALCNKVEELNRGLGEAQKTISMMSFSKNPMKIRSYKELGAIAKFIEPDNISELTLFAHELLDDIMAYDQKYGADLFHTLYCYLENNGHMKNTAKEMHISLGSARYRLTRIQEIGGFDLSTSQGFFDAHVAVQVFLLLGLIEIS